MDPLQLHFGLGQWSYIDSITVKWPALNLETNQPKHITYNGPIDSDLRYTIFENIDYPFTRIKGDINGDDGVNVLDVLSLVNSFFDDYYLSQDQIWSGDMTSDNILDITDIVFLVNFIFVH